jgi:hypothetical protein
VDAGFNKAFIEWLPLLCYYFKMIDHAHYKVCFPRRVALLTNCRVANKDRYFYSLVLQM